MLSVYCQYTAIAITAISTAANALAVEQLYLVAVQLVYSLYYVLSVLLLYLHSSLLVD
jgi:hypothetical protein